MKGNRRAHCARITESHRSGNKTCTYPGCEFSVVMMGLSPSFFRFLIRPELPFEGAAADAADVAAGLGSMGDCAPFIVIVCLWSMSWTERNV